MARNRIIKPEFWADAKVGRLSFGARLLFISMWNFADDYGTISASPRKLLGEAFENDEAVTIENVREWLVEIEAQGQIRKYTACEKDWYEIAKFKDHQRISHKSTRTNPQPPAQLSGDSPAGLRQDTGSNVNVNDNVNGNDNGNGATAQKIPSFSRQLAEHHLKKLAAFDTLLLPDLDRKPPPDYVLMLYEIAERRVGRNMVGEESAWEAAEKALNWMRDDKFWQQHANIMWLLDLKGSGKNALANIKKIADKANWYKAESDRLDAEYIKHGVTKTK